MVPGACGDVRGWVGCSASMSAQRDRIDREMNHYGVDRTQGALTLVDAA